MRKRMFRAVSGALLVVVVAYTYVAAVHATGGSHQAANQMRSAEIALKSPTIESGFMSERDSQSFQLVAMNQVPQVGEMPTIDNEAAIAGQFDPSVRKSLENSQLVRQFKVRAILDWKPLPNKNAKRILLAVDDSAPRRGLHPREGSDLWQIDANGAERLVGTKVSWARLSPNGEKLVYATSQRDVIVETGDGQLLLEVKRGYDANWSPNGRSIVVSRISEGSNLAMPEWLAIDTIEIDAGIFRNLTHGAYDDHRPEFHPSGRWVIFVSATRTGIASFWRVSADGGDATQLTNIGATTVDDRFVPTPFKRTLWSSDGRWFIYDHKETELDDEVWALEFSQDELARAVKIATGLNPQWVEDGVSVAIQTMVNGEIEPIIVKLPQ